MLTRITYYNANRQYHSWLEFDATPDGIYFRTEFTGGIDKWLVCRFTSSLFAPLVLSEFDKVCTTKQFYDLLAKYGPNQEKILGYSQTVYKRIDYKLWKTPKAKTKFAKIAGFMPNAASTTAKILRTKPARNSSKTHSMKNQLQLNFDEL